MISCTIYSADGKYVRAITVPDEAGILLNMDDPSDVVVEGMHGADTILIDGVIHVLPPSTSVLLAELRAERDRRLAACDWTQMPDAPLSESQRAAWRAYRQALRDLTDATPDPSAPNWPAAPTSQEP